MAKRKQANPRDDYYDRVQVSRDPAFLYVRPSSDSELDQIELNLGAKVPHSYREFLKRFGSGVLEEWIQLCPILPAHDWKTSGTLVHNTLYTRSSSVLPQRQNPEWLASLVYFARDNAGGDYVWDPNAATQQNQREYRFFYFQRLDNPIAAGGSFCEFLQWNASRMQRRGRNPDAVIPTVYKFTPNLLRRKKPPLKRDVNQWLAFNNHTVRDLATSIRDENRPDAFPILADALEEAGCTNADLLESCRRGDPDIDGLWVLRVLLGQ